MIKSALNLLEDDPELQAWWQSVLMDERFSKIVNANLAALEQELPTLLPGGSIIEGMALAHAGGVAARAALRNLDNLGSEGMGRARMAQANVKAAADVLSPGAAGRWPGRVAQGYRPEPAGPPPPPNVGGSDR